LGKYTSEFYVPSDKVFEGIIIEGVALQIETRRIYGIV
jgi:hypothetical protein